MVSGLAIGRFLLIEGNGSENIFMLVLDLLFKQKNSTDEEKTQMSTLLLPLCHCCLYKCSYKEIFFHSTRDLIAKRNCS